MVLNDQVMQYQVHLSSSSWPLEVRSRYSQIWDADLISMVVVKKQVNTLVISILSFIIDESYDYFLPLDTVIGA